MSTQPTRDATPSAVLKDEHKVILRVIRVLHTLVERSKSGSGFEVELLKQCVEFFRHFADDCHHAKEENLLFPVLESRAKSWRPSPTTSPFRPPCSTSLWPSLIMLWDTFPTKLDRL